MPIDIALLAMLTLFQVKHFVADYLMQPGWMLAGKGDLRSAGGYAHAGIHAIGSLPAYACAGLGAGDATLLMGAEFAVHYLIDFGKAELSGRVRTRPSEQLYWSLHGADQLLHQLTYAGLMLATVMMGAAA